MSRTARPKQFLLLTDETSLFQQTLLRLADDDRYSDPIVITNEEYRFLVAEQALEVGISFAAIVLEPVVRNTGPAIVAGTLVAQDLFGDPLIHILPSDHQIKVNEEYDRAIAAAVAAAQDNFLVTFGITPTEPATGFGYIKVGASLHSGAYSVEHFVEKPDTETAEAMLESGEFSWNSGMFIFRAETFLSECRLLAADITSAAESAALEASRDLDFLRLDEEAFAKAPNISIDYAVFEKSGKVAVVPASIDWSDLGSWDAVWKTGQHDERGNVQRGPVTLGSVSRSMVISEKHHLVVDGLDDIAVLASEDAVYVGRLSSAQQVGEMVKRLKADPKTRDLTEIHQTSYRPWGGYSSILKGERFQVKRLFVASGKRLSLQKHHHRAEHWIVVKGTAEVQIDEKVLLLRENESIYIPQGSLHRLSNPGKILLELIEVQTGSYLGEDDIVRIEDEFGRC